MAEENKNKRAVSALVATVLLLLITVAAVGLIWGLIMPALQEKVTEFDKSCINSKMIVDTKEGYTCFDNGNNQVKIMVSRGPEDFELYAIQIILSAGGISKTFDIIEDLPGVNEDRTYQVDLAGSALTGKIIEGAAIAPIIKIGDSKHICSITSKVKMSNCV